MTGLDAYSQQSLYYVIYISNFFGGNCELVYLPPENIIGRFTRSGPLTIWTACDKEILTGRDKPPLAAGVNRSKSLYFG